jgi:hypothetical protein
MPLQDYEFMVNQLEGKKFIFTEKNESATVRNLKTK